MPLNSCLSVTFPKLNPDAPFYQQVPMIIQGSVITCSLASLNIPCSSSTPDSLTLSQIPAQTSLANLAFQITGGIKNPVSFNPVEVTIKTLTSDQLGVIDQGSAIFSVALPATIDPTTALVNATDTSTVQEYSTFTIDFTSPLPLSVGTQVIVVFPNDFTFDSQVLTSVQGQGIFGALKSLSYVPNVQQMSIAIKNGIQNYREPGIQGTLIISQIKNPMTTRPTGSFKIYLTDANGVKIALIEDSITYTATIGVIGNVAVNGSMLLVDSLNDISVQFEPTHKLSAFSSTIEIILPENLIIPSNCTIVQGQGFTGSSFSYSFKQGNKILISNLFSSQYTGGIVSLIIHNVINPPSTQIVQGIIISTYDNGYMVDQIYNQTLQLFSLSPSLFFSVKITPGSFNSFNLTVFTFVMQISDNIPVGGLIRLKIPPEIEVNKPMCTGILNIQIGGLQCTVSSDSLVMLISNGFTTTGATSGAIIKFSISGLRTPISTKTSSTFIAETLDNNLYQINQLSDLLAITMLTGANIYQMKVISSCSVVGQLTTITLTFVTPLPLSTTDILFVTIPPEVIITSNFTCSGSDGLFLSQKCTLNGNILTVNMQLVSSPLTIMSVITLNIMNVINPSSSQPTSEFQVQILQKEGYILAQSVPGNGAFFEVSSTGTITQANITVMDLRQMALTTITLSFVPVTQIPIGGLLQFNFNRIQFIFPDDTFSCTTNLIQNVHCNFTSQNEIIVSNIFPLQPFLPGGLITFTIDNCLLNVNKAMTTSSWSITTLSPAGYPIDRVQTGLNISFPCNLPCLTCPASSPSQCNSCNTLSATILYQNQCYNQCPQGLYVNEYNQCMRCDSKCLTCKSDNAQYCLTCDPLSPQYNYLDGTTCVGQCNFGMFQNALTNKCEMCSAKCLACQGNASNCIQCSNTTLLHQGKCLDSCPLGFTASAGYCLKCDQNCQQCQGISTFCTSCNKNQTLSLVDNTCVSQCPFGISIYDPKLNACQICSSQCSTCNLKSNFCTSCPSSQYLNQTTGSCSGQCSQDGRTVGVDGVCQACSQNCDKCVGRPDACLSCNLKLSKHLYDSTCVTQCPTGYDLNLTLNQCAIFGLRCPFGQGLNSAGNGCILNSQVCEVGFRLNSSQDKCIPIPGQYVPFPLLITCLFLTIFVILSKMKHKETLVLTNMISVFSFVESIGILVQLILSYQMGIVSCFSLTLISALSLFGCNILFSLLFIKHVNTDSAFKYWAQTYSLTRIFALTIGGSINFKLYRVIYGRFFGRQNFNAMFDSSESFFKPFTLISIFSIVTTMVPLLIANICGLIFLDYGYQLGINCIELTFIEIGLLAMMICEKLQLKKHVIKDSTYYKVQPKLLENQNVMSTYGDQTFASGQTLHTSISGVLNTISAIRATTYQEHYERRRNLEQLVQLLTNSSKSREHQHTFSTEDQVLELQQDDRVRLRVRKCSSCQDLSREDTFQIVGDESDLQNFISEPVSPREKQMLQNQKFAGSVKEFKKAVKSRDQYDNVYAESSEPHFFKNSKLTQTKQVQTNILELIALDDSISFKHRFNNTQDKKLDIIIEDTLLSDSHSDYSSKMPLFIAPPEKRIHTASQYNRLLMDTQQQSSDVKSKKVTSLKKRSGIISSVNSRMADAPHIEDFFTQVIRPVQPQTKEEFFSRNKGIYSGQQKSPQSYSSNYQQPLKMSSIGIFDNLDLHHLTNQDTLKKGPMDSLMRLTEIKSKLNTSTYDEDLALLKQLESYERSQIQVPQFKSNLAKKNLAKVYGKAANRKKEQSSVYKDDSSTQDVKKRSVTHDGGIDQRVRNLESIYMNRPASQITYKSRQQHTGFKSIQPAMSINDEEGFQQIRNNKRQPNKQLLTDGGWI